MWRNEELNRFSVANPGCLEGVDVLFVIGSADVSGGTNVIFNHAAALAHFGANIEICTTVGTKSDANWHPKAPELAFCNLNEATKRFWDLVIVTWWPTVYVLPQLQFGRAAYFVQSLENRFALNSSDRFAEAKASMTYSFGLPVITVASWLNNFLVANTKSQSILVRNGVDKALFRVDGPRIEKHNPNRLRILIEGPSGIPMKAVDESIEACKGLDLEVWHVSPILDRTNTSVDRAFGRVPLKDMACIYRSVDVLLKLSRVEGMFGPPIEAFHCGATAIVSEVTGYDEYIRNGINALTVPVDGFLEARLAMSDLSDSGHRLTSLKANAQTTASAWPSIEESGENFVSACVAILLGEFENPKEITDRILIAQERLKSGNKVDDHREVGQ